MKEVKLSEILSLIESGKTRKEISEMYGLTPAQARQLFNHEALKGKRAKKNPLHIVNDLNLGAIQISPEDVEDPDILPTEDMLVDKFDFESESDFVAGTDY